MMTFTQYRAAALKIFWPQAEKSLDMRERDIINHDNFKTSAINNICATYWKYEDPLRFCVSGLMTHIKEIIGG